MRLTGLHLLLTYQCTFECDHCFVWGSPFQSGTMTLADTEYILEQAGQIPSLTSIYFEGGEPFLYYPLLVKGVQRAASMGFQVGIVSNAYWANSVADALAWLQPFQGLIDDLSVSSDLYHYNETISHQVQNAQTAAQQLGLPLGVISVAQPESNDAARQTGQLSLGESGIMYRGRAVEVLAPRAAKQPWHRFTTCPYEDLREPGRLHLDPIGHLHICQGISIGNVYAQPLAEICAAYDPDTHPVAGPLLRGGPLALIEAYNLPHEDQYAGACHLCYRARTALRPRLPDILAPDQIYGKF
ncbi:MAG TPA: radical SAM protein [Anaerolineales bacterium]